MKELKDVQSFKDERNIRINKVGVKNLKYPIILLDKINNKQHTIASINMYVMLPSHFKGTHMSRFIEILNKNRNGIDIKRIGFILKEMRERLNAEKSYMEMKFSYFIKKFSPITNIPSLMNYDCEVDALGDNYKDVIYIEVSVPVLSLCPCSKEISNYGAHNQRGLVNVRIKIDKMVWIEDIVRLVEESASCDLYALLKRPDEKYVTEKAYNNPMFAEDIARNVFMKIKTVINPKYFFVEVENFESIHNHNAYAFIEL